MARLFGREWTRHELLSYVGELSQVAGPRQIEFTDGRARGVRAVEMRTGAGLRFTVLLDRGMDIGPADFRGLPLAWLSPAGFAHPSYYEPEGDGWLRTFGGGLLVGCGLTYLGAPDEDEGQQLGLHGRLSLLPAEQTQIGERWEGDECLFWVEGCMRQARLFGENLVLRRRIMAGLGHNQVAIHDTIENLAEEPTPLMLLYHINLGYPLLDETSYLEAEPHTVRPRDGVAEPGLAEWNRFQPPTAHYDEQVFYHDLAEDADGWADISLFNPTRGLRLTVHYDKSTLPQFVQWKQMGRGAYALGLEPANCRVEGRSTERARGTLQYIQPGEQREFRLEIRVEER